MCGELFSRSLKPKKQTYSRREGELGVKNWFLLEENVFFDLKVLDPANRGRLRRVGGEYFVQRSPNTSHGWALALG